MELVTKPESHLPHPVDPTPHAPRGHVNVCSTMDPTYPTPSCRLEAVGGEVVVAQVLPIVVGAHVIDVHLQPKKNLSRFRQDKEILVSAYG